MYSHRDLFKSFLISFKTPTQARRCGNPRCLPLLWQGVGVGGARGKRRLLENCQLMRTIEHRLALSP